MTPAHEPEPSIRVNLFRFLASFLWGQKAVENLQTTLSEADLLEMRKSYFLVSWRKAGSWADPINRHWMCAEVLYKKAVEAKEKHDKRLREEHEGLRTGTIKPGQRMLEGEELQNHLEHRGFIHEYFLLVGLALECAFKGFLFARDPSLISDTTLKVDSFGTGHDLKVLCGKCGITPSSDEEKLLEYLTFQTTHGKYPAPLTFEQKEKQKRLDFDQYAQREIASRLIFRVGKMLDELRVTPPSKP